MIQTLTQTLSRLFLQLFFLGLLLSFALGLNYLHAWTAPTQAPTGGNVAAPLNTGGTLQGKSGGLTLGSTLDIGSSLSVGGVLADSASYLIDMGAATPGATAGIRFPDDTVQTTAASAGGSLGLSFSKYMHVREQYASGVNGPVIPNAWTKRVLNTTVTPNTISGASFSAVTNQITLPAGTYYIEADAVVLSGGHTRNALYNVTDVSYPVYGISGFGNGGGEDQGSIGSPLAQTFTISAQKVFEFHSRTGDSGYCYANAYSVPEVCSEVKIWKLD